ncbi:cytochrome P450 [Myxococcota bacterium]|nr:cytochrome P450 [Myxococcota bacterium]
MVKRTDMQSAIGVGNILSGSDFPHEEGTWPATGEMASTTTPRLEDLDFGLQEFPGESLHLALRAFRERSPVEPTRFLGLPSFVITSHEALEQAFLDEHVFPGHRMYQASFEPAIGRSFISDPDPASHLLFRKLATPAFRSRAVASYEQSGLASLANELVDRLADRSEFDLAKDFAARFPYLMISRLLGLPRDREDEFHAWALALFNFREDPARAGEARKSLSELILPVLEERRRAPQNDVISELLAAEVDGRKLSDEEILSHVRLLFPTGGETTHGSLGNLLSALLLHDGAWQTLVRHPEKIPAAVNEALRFDTPIAVLPRLSRSEPTSFRGLEIPADTWVLFAMAGANRDPAVVRDPDRFDIDRVQPPNLVFGRGAKSCPGLHLARRNMAVAVEVLTRRFPALELVDRESARPRRTVLRAPAALRVRRNERPATGRPATAVGDRISADR